MLRNSLSLLLLAVALPSLSAAPPKHDASAQFEQAIRLNDLATLRKLVRQYGVNSQDKAGNTPLLYAAGFGSPKAVELLLQSGAHPNHRNAAGATALMWGAGSLAKVKALCAHGAGVNMKSKFGRTPLMLAAERVSATDSLSFLLARGAKVNAYDSGGDGPLTYACSNDAFANAKILVDKGANVNKVDKAGITPLIAGVGIDYDSAPLAELLLSHGANPNKVTKPVSSKVLNGPIMIGRQTALQLAAGASGDATELVLRAGAKVSTLDVRKGNALTFAVAVDHPDLKAIDLLLKAGCDPKPALPWVKKFNNPAVLQAFGLTSQPVQEASVSESDVTAKRANAAAARALYLSQKVNTKFLEKGGCLSCHSNHMAAPAASLLASNSTLNKLRVQLKPLAEGWCESNANARFELEDPGGSFHTLAWTLENLKDSGTKPCLATDSLINYVLSMQYASGLWPGPGGRAPLEEGPFVITVRCIRALTLYKMPAIQSQIDTAIKRAVDKISSLQPSTVVDAAVRIQGVAWGGGKVDPQWVEDLLGKQRANGGWGQTDNLPADAYGTAYVLLALEAAGQDMEDQRVKRGLNFLLSTQAKDGSWHVKTRAFAIQPYFQSGFPYEHDQWISQAATSLAAEALARYALAPKPKQVAMVAKPTAK